MRNSLPIHSSSYQTGPKLREFEKQNIDLLLTMHAIEPSQTKWPLPIVLVQMKDCRRCFCVNYRNFNAGTMQDSYPIPYMEQCIASLGKSTVLYTLDAGKGHRSIVNNHRGNTVSTSWHWGFRFSTMLLGLNSFRNVSMSDRTLSYETQVAVCPHHL